MKKITAILLGTLIASSAALAQTNQVLSRNAVGYIKIDMASNKLYFVSNPFVPLSEGGDIVSNQFASVPNGSSVSLWDETSQSYLSFAKSARGLWSANATTKLNRADAMFVRMPATVGTSIYFMGEVPDQTTAPTSTQQRVAGVTMLGYPYPVEASFTGTPMAVSLPNSSSISVWDSSSQSYVTYSKSARGLWNAEATTATVSPGQGFVIRATVPGAINTTKPYQWP